MDAALIAPQLEQRVEPSLILEGLTNDLVVVAVEEPPWAAPCSTPVITGCFDGTPLITSPAGSTEEQG